MRPIVQKGWRSLTSFGSRLTASFDACGQLCVGIDPHSWLLHEWGLPDSAEGAQEFGLRVVEAAAGRVGVIKPQVAFYERFGAAGYAALEVVLAAARASELLVVADTKRGDVGTSVEAYGQAWLTPGSPLEVDAITVSAFQGLGSLGAPLELAESSGKGLFVLAATSNPESVEIQQARGREGTTVSQMIVHGATAWNSTRAGSGLGSLGVVIGATIVPADYGIDIGTLGSTPILVPGFGHQGARYSQLGQLFGDSAHAALVSVSRSILSAGPSGIAQAIRSHAAEVAECRA